MTNQDFEILVEKVNNKLKRLMLKKGEEYSGDVDRLENFKRAAAVDGCTPAEALYGMVNKHWVSISMMKDDPTKYSKKQWDEKINDVLVYMFLFHAVLEDMGVE